MKAQTSIEMLIIVAVSLVVLVAVVAFAGDQIGTINQHTDSDKAQKSVEDLRDAVREVYAEGMGAKKPVFIEIPHSIDPTRTGLEGEAIVINIAGSDFIAETGITLAGSIPTEPGGHNVWVEAREGFVFIGLGKISLDTESVYVTMPQSSNASDSILVTNNSGYGVDVFVSTVWPHSDVTLNPTPASFSIIDGGSGTIDLAFSSSGAAIGNYPGTLEIDVAIPDGDENLSIPLNAEVLVGSGGGSPLALYAGTWSSSTVGGGSDSAGFQACNSSDSALSTVSFANSTGDAGDWVGAISTIASIAAQSCENFNIIYTVPGGTSSGLHTGTVTATDAATNEDSVSLQITIESLAAAFNFSWSGASFNGPGNRLQNWLIENTDTEDLTITRIIVWDWNEADLDDALVNDVRMNDVDLLPGGTYSAGEWIDITDFTIPASTSYQSNNNYIRFSSRANEDGEYFRITFEFSDSSTYTTAVFETVDSTPPVILLELPTNGHDEDTNSTIQFDYEVSDATSGIASCSLILDGSVDQTDNSITEDTTQSFVKDLGNGSYTWDVNCTDDAAGSNEGTSGENRDLNVSVPPDTTPPVIILESPAAGYEEDSNSSIQFDYNVTDAASGIASCSLILDGAVDQTNNSITEGTTQSFVKTMSNGTYTWDVNCTDDAPASNQGTSGAARALDVNIVAVLGYISIAFDNFDSGGWGGGTGWLGTWYHSGDSSVTTSGTAYSPAYHLRLRRATGYADRSVDLSAAITPRIRFWAKANSFESGEEAYLLVSDDDSNWTVVYAWVNGDDDNIYHYYDIPLDGILLSSTFWIAFDAEMSNNQDQFYVDDLNIVGLSS
ncbi:MAG: hypothetical protein ABID38_02555 [Candidatus Diapherotrites archaeon]